MKTEDNRITQYALGELTGAEREAFEKEMAIDPELLEEVRQTQNFCEPFPIESEAKTVFSDDERTELHERWMANRAAQRRGAWVKRVWVYSGIGTVAACLVASLALPVVPAALVKSKSVDAKKVDEDSTWKLLAAVPQSTPMSLGVIPPEAPSVGMQSRAESELFAANVTEATKLSEFQVSSAPVPSIGVTVDAPESRSLAVTGGVAANASITSGSVARDASQAGFVVLRKDGGRVASSNSLQNVDKKWENPVRHDRSQQGNFRQNSEFNAESYDALVENSFLSVTENPLSTFSIDVDTASYSNIRRFLQQQDQLPPKGAVRIEEMINYFPYSYPQPEAKEAFSVNVETGRAPWNLLHQLVRVALKGRELSAEKRPASNLVFLIDVSGSMNEPNKLPLLQKSLSELASRLAPTDRVAIVVYAGSSGLVLPSTANKSEVLNALDRLKAGGSTNGGEGIKLAYEQARKHFVEEGNNRVILCTDGDFNVGVTNQQALVDLIEKERASGVFLSVLGFGSGNLKDSQMEKLADKGNGNYAYIDSPTEGRKVLVEQMGATLFTIAKDVKIQVEFNPATVTGYRLVGYENRLLAKEDFNDDKKDAGEIGAGHTVTAFYEVVPIGQPLPDAPSVDPLKYQKPEQSAADEGNELLTVKLRYKQPEGSVSKLLEVSVPNDAKDFEKCSTDFQFAAAVAGFGLKLRESKYVGDLSWTEIQKIARANLGEDPGSYRAEFLTIVEKARQISRDREMQKTLDE